MLRTSEEEKGVAGEHEGERDPPDAGDSPRFGVGTHFFAPGGSRLEKEGYSLLLEFGFPLQDSEFLQEAQPVLFDSKAAGSGGVGGG